LMCALLYTVSRHSVNRKELFLIADVFALRPPFVVLIETGNR
jgi:hypothetical protein